MSVDLSIGMLAPDFDLEAHGGSGRIADYRDRWLVLYFYPKDDTPGCTTEAVAFSNLLSDFTSAGAAILGVSKDPLPKHEKFTAKHDLKIPLAADTEGTACEKYGVWVEKKMYGKTYMGIERATFLIDSDGLITQIWRKVRVKGHAEAVLEAVHNA